MQGFRIATIRFSPGRNAQTQKSLQSFPKAPVCFPTCARPRQLCPGRSAGSSPRACTSSIAGVGMEQRRNSSNTSTVINRRLKGLISGTILNQSWATSSGKLMLRFDFQGFVVRALTLLARPVKSRSYEVHSQDCNLVGFLN